MSHRSNSRFNRACNRVIRFMEVVVCVILALLVVDVLWGVFTRFVLNQQSRWTEEVAIYLLIWVSLLGAAVTYAENGHLGVDYLVQKMDTQTRKIGEGAAHLIVLLFAAYGLLYGGFELVSETMMAGQVSPAIGISMAVVYAAVPISGVLFILFAARALYNLPDETAPHDEHEQISDI